MGLAEHRRTADGRREAPHHRTAQATRTPWNVEVGRMSQTTSAGIGFGTALAICISWSLHKSIFWACVHGLFSWLYVIYFWLTR